ncbi:NAD-dependent succinate-semialdehyde dehydrogenase [Cryptosporangium phraense]|uniref:NAD-dependent succinate-semialdehyde dehydrogenase n=1 Tax=Cryptosporangium phraense TaxID=2593070 RepID=A0A545ARJ9_9ACTN|nr:NAD-dependent succinate-semialdehyde dehydrogenase [Cryptosporangium phraense]TQS43950.1 NAD-dependent succinate-semialdehyde dehydrogenase [Cryptosporangium phraense]
MTDIASLDPGHGLVIAGQRRKGGSGLFDVDDPATGAPLASVADGDQDDATAAVDAAAAAFPAWRRTPGRVRSEILRRTYELMISDADRLTGLIAAENGKSRSDARGEVVYAAEFFRWFAEEAARSGGSYGPSPAGGTRTLVTEHPVGVAALVTPWNFPAAMATRKIAPALAAGCTVVLKPAAETPLTAIALLDLLAEAGVPDGVVNLVPTTDAGGVVGTWLADPRVRKISFTGSTRVGRLLLRQAADRVVNSSMELGGNAPFIVTEDADLEAAVDGAMIAKFRGGGQACTAANRFYVHRNVVEEFTARFGVRLEALTVGPAADSSDVGPLISPTAVQTVTGLVDRAVAAGARVVARAEVPANGGYFYPPTALRLPDDARLATSEILDAEIFGPVATIVAWTDEDAMLADANASEMGLAAYVYAGDLGRAVRIGEALEAGMVGVNRGLVSDPAAPFGGMKQSGLGREGARAGLEEFTETQYLSVDWP